MCSGVAPAGKERSEGPIHRQGAGSQRQEKGSAGFSRSGTCSTSKRKFSISSNQRARNRLTSRLLRSHVTAWLSVQGVKSNRTPGGRGAPLPRRRKDSQGMDDRQQLEDVSWIRLLCRREFATFVGDRVVTAIVVGLHQDRRDGLLTNIRREDKASTRVEGA